MNGLELWSLEEAHDNFAPLNEFGSTFIPFDNFNHFVYVPYADFSTKTEPLKEYMAEHPDIGVYLGRVDLSDCRHVVLGFPSPEARRQFLATEGIIVKR